jgi:hypothetical protein
MSAISVTTSQTAEQADPNQTYCSTYNTCSKNETFSTDIVKGKLEKYIVKYYLGYIFSAH